MFGSGQDHVQRTPVGLGSVPKLDLGWCFAQLVGLGSVPHFGSGRNQDAAALVVCSY